MTYKVHNYEYTRLSTLLRVAYMLHYTSNKLKMQLSGQSKLAITGQDVNPQLKMLDEYDSDGFSA